MGLFNKNMTFSEAQAVYFQSIDGKSPSEAARIATEYVKILQVIVPRDLEESRKSAETAD